MGTQKPRFSLVYTLGLFDYLSDRLAARVARARWETLAPGGQLVANFAPNFPGAGYMEMMMDWWLHSRSAAELAECWSEIPARKLHQRRRFQTPGR
jgi:extracellular factor (EF) 3-hydroxypalmitic acid methyl ester biosynthesis protein